MPLYMDRHDIEGVTPEALSEAHQKDLEIQHKHGARYLNYWHDQARGCVFCLVEAPSKEAASVDRSIAVERRCFRHRFSSDPLHGSARFHQVHGRVRRCQSDGTYAHSQRDGS